MKFKELSYNISIAAAVVSAIALAWLALFPTPLDLFSWTVPAWLLVAFLAALCSGSIGLVARQSDRRFGFLLALHIVPALSISQARGMLSPGTDGQELVLSVLWAVAVVELAYEARPQLFEGLTWKALTAFAVSLTVIWSVFVHLARFNADSILINGFLVLAWAAVVRWMPDRGEGKDNKKQFIHLVWTACIGIIVLWGAWLRIAAVDTFAFQNDEYYHVEAAAGYLETGEYKLWNFVFNEPEEEYDRAWVYTWQVAQSFKLFGFSEVSGRLPTLLWGLFFLALVPLLAYSWTRSRGVAFLATAIAAFDNGFVWACTYSRMYTMLQVLILAGVWCFWMALRNVKRKRPWTRWLWLAAAVLLVLAAAYIHASGLLIFGGMAVAIWLLYFFNRTNTWYRLLSILFIAGSFAAILYSKLQSQIWLNLITVRKEAAVQYLAYPFQDLVITILGMILFIVAFIAYKKEKLPTWLIIAGSTTIPAVIYFTYFAGRYGARKYSLFFLVFIYIAIAWVWNRVLRQWTAHSWKRLVIGTFITVWVFVPISIPGVEGSFVTRTARADLTYRDVGLHDYKIAYAAVQEEAKTDDAIVILAPRSYYLYRTDVDYFIMPVNNAMTVEMLEEVMTQKARGWVIWPRFKEFHLSRKFTNYVKDNLHPFEGTKGTQVRVYYWDRVQDALDQIDQIKELESERTEE
ncbi:MAG: phospholipid carrier-dependent glycosyltransferase [Candidatus Kerfeldbacteria bacterium]